RRRLYLRYKVMKDRAVLKTRRLTHLGNKPGS
ncbi:hypothetical protein D018_0692B, partial [Vibrio parahaemolyticus VP2007-007]